MSAFPPHRSTPTLSVSKAAALKHLQTYLEATKTSPYLLPNARIEPTGPTANASSVTIHNLQRVEAGLRGEWLAPVLELAEKTNSAIGGIEIAKGMDDGVNQGTEGGEWQDAEEYARQQSIEEGDVAPRGTALGQHGDDGFQNETEEVVETSSAKRKLEDGATESDKVTNKKAKKEAKKLKIKEEKRKRRATVKLQQETEET